MRDVFNFFVVYCATSFLISFEYFTQFLAQYIQGVSSNRVEQRDTLLILSSVDLSLFLRKSFSLSLSVSFSVSLSFSNLHSLYLSLSHRPSSSSSSISSHYLFLLSLFPLTPYPSFCPSLYYFLLSKYIAKNCNWCHNADQLTHFLSEHLILKIVYNIRTHYLVTL